jgi:RNA polymerase sigma-70 factor (ECF subfamily)
MRDEQFLREVYEGSYRRLVAGLYAISGDLAVAEDVVQEAFVRALARIRDFRKVDNPEAWLRRVAINVHHTRYRRMQQLSVLYRRTGVPPATAPTDIETDHVALIEALRTLPQSQREAVALHHFMDLSVAEIATTLNVPDGTVKARLSRGRAALAERLRETPEEVRHA